MAMIAVDRNVAYEQAAEPERYTTGQTISKMQAEIAELQDMLRGALHQIEMLERFAGRTEDELGVQLR